MNILVINVSLRPNSPLKLFPIGLGYIVTAMKNAGFAFDLLDIDAHRYSDEEVERRIRQKKYDVVCMGCIVTGYKMIKALTSVVKLHHPRSVIIVGNSVATSVVDTLLTRTQADIAVMSEGDETIVDLLKTLAGSGPLENVRGICFKKDGQVIRTPLRPQIKDLSILPFIDFSIFDVDFYIESSTLAVSDPLPIPRKQIRALPINTARGCVADCTFCYHVFKEVPYRYRSPESSVSEIKLMLSTYNLNYILMWDELTFYNKQQTLAFVERIIQEGLRFYWVGLCRGNLFQEDADLEIMKKMKEAGCIGMGYSLESAEPDILRAMNKHMTVEQFSRQTRLFHQAGIHVVTSLVFGYPQETPESIRKTFDCCIENRIYPSAGYLLPQPGSVMYDYAVKRGLIGEEEEYLLKMGDRQDLRLNMTKMSDQDLEKHVLEGLKRCNDELKVGLQYEELMKTTYYRSAKKEWAVKVKGAITQKNQQPFLATTALKDFWDTSKPLLFLGGWCKRYSRKPFWEPLAGEVLPSPWQDTQELYGACDYVSAVYERLLPVLGEALNAAHRVNHSVRYWRIFLGPWLQLYIPALYDRYMCLRYALDRYPRFTTTVLARDNWVTPINTLEFVQLLKEDSYNLQMYSRIFSALGMVFPEKVTNVVVTPFDTVMVNHSFTGQVKNLFLRCIVAIEKSMKEGQKIIFRSSYFSPVVELQLILKTSGKVCPIHTNIENLNALEKDAHIRENLQNLLSKNEFECLLSQLLPLDLPLCFVEGFEELRHAGNSIYPLKSKAIFSSVAWYYDEVFKQWAAASAERGNQLLGVQHGGNYGSLRYHPSEDHEIEITDRYFTWGWERPDVPTKVIPWFASKLSGRKSLPADNGKQGILFVATSWPRYLFQFPNMPNRFEEYLLWQFRFLASIDARHLSQFRVRFHREDFGWDMAQRWNDFYPKIVTESWDITFQESLSNCRIYICDQLATTFLEALSADKPTILFWDPEINELRPEAQPYYDRLRTAGILFDTPEAAAAGVTAVYDDITSWWNKPERQAARRFFCNRFARTSANSVDEWASEFVRISRESSETH